MVQKFPLSLNASAESRLGRDERIKRAVVRQALSASTLPGNSAAQDAATAERYYLRYSVPTLEATGLIDAAEPEEAILWGTIQLLYGLSGRHSDNVLDAQVEPSDVPTELRQAQAYLEHAQRLLSEHAKGWTPRHSVLYRQFLDYECEARAGELHDLSTLWRRVSPLCIVLEIDLAHRVRDPRLVLAHRRFLAYSLLRGDCQEAWQDLANGPDTPVTRMLAESRTHNASDFESLSKRLQWIRSFNERERTQLLGVIGSLNCPRWFALLQQDADAREGARV